MFHLVQLNLHQIEISTRISPFLFRIEAISKFDFEFRLLSASAIHTMLKICIVNPKANAIDQTKKVGIINLHVLEHPSSPKG
jgi:hypothetical protein